VFGVINKAFLVGLAAMAGEKVDEFARELAEKGKLSEAEAHKLAENMLKKSAQTKKDLQAQVEKWLEQSLHKVRLPTKDHIDSLKARIAEPEDRIGPAEARP